MKEQEIRVLRDTLKTLDEMQGSLDAAQAALRTLLVYGHEAYTPCSREKAAYEAERICREPLDYWKNKAAHLDREGQ